MLTISRMAEKTRGIAIGSFLAAAITIALIVPACSSDSNDAPDDAGIADVLFPQACTTPIQISAGAQGTATYSGGACTASLANVSCTYQAACAFTDITIYTCTCDGTSWSCTVTGDVEGGACDAGFTDASEEPVDASDASADDDADLDASDADAS